MNPNRNTDNREIFNFASQFLHVMKTSLNAKIVNPLSNLSNSDYDKDLREKIIKTTYKDAKKNLHLCDFITITSRIRDNRPVKEIEEMLLETIFFSKNPFEGNVNDLLHKSKEKFYRYFFFNGESKSITGNNFMCKSNIYPTKDCYLILFDNLLSFFGNYALSKPYKGTLKIESNLKVENNSMTFITKGIKQPLPKKDYNNKSLLNSLDLFDEIFRYTKMGRIEAKQENNCTILSLQSY